MIGNQAVNRLLHSSRIQPTHRISEPGDAYEQEADWVADQALAAAALSAGSVAPPIVQRYTGPATGQADTAPTGVDHVLASPGRPLDPALRQDMEQHFDHHFGRVRVHTDSRAAESARKVYALAYTVGSHLVFGAGQFAPTTPGGRELLAHELAHTIQQRSSNAAPPSPAPDGVFEKTADVAGRDVANGRPAPTYRSERSPAQDAEPVLSDTANAGRPPLRDPLRQPDLMPEAKPTTTTVPKETPHATVEPPQQATDKGVTDRGYRPQAGQRTTRPEQWKKQESARRWKAAVDEALSGDLSDRIDTPKVTGGPASGYRTGGRKVPGEPPSRLDLDALPGTSDAPVPRRPGETARQAVARVRTVIGTKLSDHPRLTQLWNQARTSILSRRTLTGDNYLELYNATRTSFWRAVQGDAQARDFLANAGFGFPGKPGSAPSLTGTDPKLSAAETGNSLDHIAEKAQVDN